MGKRTREYVYGINPAFEVMRGAKRKVYAAYVSESSARNPRMKKLVDYLERSEVPLEWVEKGRVKDLSGSKDNQGVVLKCGVYPYVPFDEILGAEKIMLLDHVEDPHNVGAILRSAEIFGFNRVLLPIRGVPDIYPSIVKVSAGATEFMHLCKDANANTYIKRLQEAGYAVISLDASGDADPHTLKERLDRPFVLVIGGEDKGVGPFVLKQSDYIMGITQQGRLNSLNASVAAGIAMYALA